MSFSTDAKNEILRAITGKKCCKTAYAVGLLFGAETDGQDKFIFSDKNEFVAHAAHKAAISAFGQDASPYEARENGGAYDLAIESRELYTVLDGIRKNGLKKTLFHCSECAVAFLRGLFISSASVTDPEKQYHLEFNIKDLKLASATYLALTEMFAPPTLINRKNGVGLVYKSSSTIEDILSVIGANNAYFALVNGKIEREIRNNENRATNCETRNIAASVDAAAKQIEAIQMLKATDKYDSLPPQLKETAEMRLLYPSLPLAELAAKFAPPLTKSGLNNRLKKILELAN